MPPQPNTFEQEFLAKIKSGPNPDNSSNAPKLKKTKPLNKKFIVLGVLLLLLISSLIISAIITNNMNKPNDIFGSWECDSGASFEFFQRDNKNIFSFEFVDPENPEETSSESGTFTLGSEEFTTISPYLIYNDEVIDLDEPIETVYDLSFTDPDSIYIFGHGYEFPFSCKRSEL